MRYHRLQRRAFDHRTRRRAQCTRRSKRSCGATPVCIRHEHPVGHRLPSHAGVPSTEARRCSPARDRRLRTLSTRRRVSRLTCPSEPFGSAVDSAGGEDCRKSTGTICWMRCTSTRMWITHVLAYPRALGGDAAHRRARAPTPILLPTHLSTYHPTYPPTRPHPPAHTRRANTHACVWHACCMLRACMCAHTHKTRIDQSCAGIALSRLRRSLLASDRRVFVRTGIDQDGSRWAGRSSLMPCGAHHAKC
jgi:hypothetical protein